MPKKSQALRILHSMADNSRADEADRKLQASQEITAKWSLAPLAFFSVQNTRWGPEAALVVQIHRGNTPSDSDGGEKVRHGRAKPAIVDSPRELCAVSDIGYHGETNQNKHWNIRC
jgi:hypothetical protein